MEWQIILLNLLYAVAGVGLMIFSYKLFDWMTPKLHLEDELIFHNRQLWNLWTVALADQRRRFMFASYNAGRATLLRAQELARRKLLDPHLWPNIEQVAAEVPRWRHVETITYVRRIEQNHSRMDAVGRVK